MPSGKTVLGRRPLWESCQPNSSPFEKFLACLPQACPKLLEARHFACWIYETRPSYFCGGSGSTCLHLLSINPFCSACLSAACLPQACPKLLEARQFACWIYETRPSYFCGGSGSTCPHPLSINPFCSACLSAACLPQACPKLLEARQFACWIYETRPSYFCGGSGSTCVHPLSINPFCSACLSATHAPTSCLRTPPS